MYVVLGVNNPICSEVVCSTRRGSGYRVGEQRRSVLATPLLCVVVALEPASKASLCAGIADPCVMAPTGASCWCGSGGNLLNSIDPDYFVFAFALFAWVARTCELVCMCQCPGYYYTSYV